MAQNNGLVIDDTYRNYNGMSWQYHFIEDLFQGKVTEGHSPSKLFANMVDTYKNNRKEYERIVCKAKKMSSEKSEDKDRKKASMNADKQEVSFYDWLKEKPKLKASPNAIIKVYRACSEYAYKHGISKKRFDDMVEPEEYLKVSEKLRSAHLFRVINRNTALLYDKTYRYFAEYLYFLKDIKASESKATDVEAAVEIESNGNLDCDADTHDNSEALANLLSNHFAYGIRLNSDIEMSRLKKYAVDDGIIISYDNDQLRKELQQIGFIAGDKLYTVSQDAIHTLKGYIKEIFSQSIDAVYYYKLMDNKYDWMEEQHITSPELLKAIIESHKSELFGDMPVHISKTFFSFSGKQTERAVVTKEMKRVWGEEQLRNISELSERLPYIPESIIKSIISRAISGNPEFVRNSENEYLLLDRFVIEDEQAQKIIEFADSTCSAKGFASLVDLPVGDLQEVYYELNLSCICNAVFDKLLADNFSLNGKIIVKKGSQELDLISLVKAYISDKQECTFDDVHAKVIELKGDSYRNAAFVALYDTMVRVTKEKFVADECVQFDVDAIDSELGRLITDHFCAVKEISTFVLFPYCGQSWNHYLLESYCYRFSKKYSYCVVNLNDKNVGIIAEKELNLDYKEMLIRAAARAKIELSPESIGRYFFETGYLGKSKNSWLEEIAEKAQALREE
ncbi:MAG: hypothetical protein LUH18_08345 [Oscillospiraceae bacterium]|nr:hypothetical protein [Oscillospiraceae bacterium]